ncbi:MAG: hypothetical protein MZU95_07520 [Desulfomicrobium escambiense]|nr:hypothetical protein [Desulfomicrobium escambiense]
MLTRRPDAPPAPFELTVYADAAGNTNYVLRSGDRMIQSDAIRAPASAHGGADQAAAEPGGDRRGQPLPRPGDGPALGQGPRHRPRRHAAGPGRHQLDHRRRQLHAAGLVVEPGPAQLAGRPHPRQPRRRGPARRRRLPRDGDLRRDPAGDRQRHADPRRVRLRRDQRRRRRGPRLAHPRTSRTRRGGRSPRSIRWRSRWPTCRRCCCAAACRWPDRAAPARATRRASSSASRRCARTPATGPASAKIPG